MAEAAVSSSALAASSQQALLREAGLCGHATRNGGFCRAPWNDDSKSCGMGHGLSSEEISRLRREAARNSHAVETKIDAWARKIDWSTTEGVYDCLEMTAEMVMRRLVSPQQAGAIAQLAGVRLRPAQKAPEDAKPLVVQVARFGAEPAA
jgi:hypothetical protein